MKFPSPGTVRSVRPHRALRGFTLVELLVVLAIAGILIGILIPVVGAVRRSAADAASTSNLHQLTAAYLLFMGDNKMSCLPSAIGPTAANPWDSQSEGHNNDGFFLLRYYYCSGPRYMWTTGNTGITESVEHDPTAKFNGLTQDPTGVAPFSIDYGVRQNGSLYSFAQFPQPARTPLIWDAFSASWNNVPPMGSSLPLRHKGGTALNCGFLDGHIESITATDKRLYSMWWLYATKGPNNTIDDTKLGQGNALGVTAVPSS